MNSFVFHFELYIEYISALEEQVRDGDDRNKELQVKNRVLQEENNNLKAEIKRLREKYGETCSPQPSAAESDAETIPPITPPSSMHSLGDDNYSPNSLTTTASSFSPHGASNFADLDFMDLYASADATPNTFASFISQAVMPNWDVSTVLQGKPGGGTLVIANRTHNPATLLREYPLLGPALMSIVVNHTLSMNLSAFNMDNFPYNESLPAYQETVWLDPAGVSGIHHFHLALMSFLRGAGIAVGLIEQAIPYCHRRYRKPSAEARRNYAISWDPGKAVEAKGSSVPRVNSFGSNV